MPRDYNAMRAVQATAAGSAHPLKYRDLWPAVRDEAAIRQELARLGRDGLIDDGIRFQGGDGCCFGGEASVTDEGREFFMLVENECVWQLVLRTLLKNVCEEIATRYVSSFIPKI